MKHWRYFVEDIHNIRRSNIIEISEKDIFKINNNNNIGGQHCHRRRQESPFVIVILTHATTHTTLYENARQALAVFYGGDRETQRKREYNTVSKSNGRRQKGKGEWVCARMACQCVRQSTARQWCSPVSDSVCGISCKTTVRRTCSHNPFRCIALYFYFLFLF